MDKFILCWHRQSRIEQVNSDQIASNWRQAVAYGDLDVLTCGEDGEAYIMDSAGGWSPVVSAERPDTQS
jgi:hypothetical protein